MLKRMLLMTCMGFSLVLGACGKNDDPQPVAAAAAACVTTAYGCLQQGSCSPGYASYNNGYSNVCVPATASPVSGGACAAGQVNTVQGCLPTGGCGPSHGQGVYNGMPWCYPAI